MKKHKLSVTQKALSKVSFLNIEMLEDYRSLEMQIPEMSQDYENTSEFLEQFQN